jgi:hypothetical protein
VAVDSSNVSGWFGEYLDAFAACGRGESDTGSLLGYYGVPLLLATDGGFFALTSDDQVVAARQQQVDGMRAGTRQLVTTSQQVRVLREQSLQEILRVIRLLAHLDERLTAHQEDAPTHTQIVSFLGPGVVCVRSDPLYANSTRTLFVSVDGSLPLVGSHRDHRLDPGPPGHAAGGAARL